MHIGARWAGRIYRVGMVRRLQAPVVAGAIVLCMLLSVVTAASAAHVRGTRSQASALLGGVNIAGYGSTAAQIDRNIASARNVGAKVVRVEVPWSALEPRAAGVIDPRALAFTDHLTSDAAAAGIKVIMMVESTPCWASSAPASIRARCRPGAAGAASAWPPTNTADYASFVAYLAQRYGPTLAALEVWNEPDQANQHYFAGPDKAARYAALLRAAYPAIKAVDPAVPVLAGSLVGSNGAFLRALYAAGIKGYYNGLSVHFYNLTLASVRSIHEVQLANGDNTPHLAQRVRLEQLLAALQHPAGTGVCDTFGAGSERVVRDPGARSRALCGRGRPLQAPGHERGRLRSSQRVRRAQARVRRDAQRDALTARAHRPDLTGAEAGAR